MSVLLGQGVDRRGDRAEVVGEGGGQAGAGGAGAVELARPRLVGVPLAREVALLLEAAQQGVERVGVGVEPARARALRAGRSRSPGSRAAAGTRARRCRAAAPAGGCRVLRSRSCITLYCVSHTIVKHTSMFQRMRRSCPSARDPASPCRAAATRRETRAMVFIGYHASHEQLPPSVLLDCRPSRGGRRLRRRDVLGPPRAVGSAAGRVGLRVELARRGAGRDILLARRGQRARSALPPGRSSRRRSRRSRRCSPAGSGRRSAAARR